jgi:hypothetical protein
LDVQTGDSVIEHGGEEFVLSDAVINCSNRVLE